MSGIVIIDKPTGWTSHDVVNKVRGILKEKRIGHTGTLDPLATGVLVLCVGSATRIVRYLESDDKEYLAEFRLGITTDTQDADGQVLETRHYTPPAADDIEAVLCGFRGVVQQRPPAYSALKVNGVPSYRLARSGREHRHPERSVTIYRLELLSFEDPMVRVKVHCSKGTYVRTLSADIGERLGTGAHLTALNRVRSGRFRLDQAISIDGLAVLATQDRVQEAVLSLASALEGMPAVHLDAAAAGRIRQGNQVPSAAGASLPPTERVRVMDAQGSLIAIGRLERGMIAPETVLM